MICKSVYGRSVVRKSKKSFILVTPEIDFNAVSHKLAVVRSLQEAHDIIDMEEIERDLGF